MSALARSGDRAGALRHARIYEALLRKELDIPPDPAVTALAARLRAEAEAAAEPVAVESGEAAAGTYEQYLKRALARRYDVQHELDRSKLAITYLARDLRHHRNVALKVIDAMLAASVDVERFLRELESVRQLEHANILPLHDVGEADGVLFCASPHIEAETLRDRLKRERQLPLGEALRIACEVADALSRAHEQRVLHRDLKPKNIVLDAGRALLSGLGLAGAIARAAGDAMTQTGVALGTPAYMSPEQAAGETQLDGRSDLYSLGCVLYQMLAGAPPLAGGTAQAVLARRWTGAPPRIRAVRDSVPVAVERALQRVLARSPADRFRTAAEFRDALGVC
jgi:serine/threonine-protein kinase